jgi:hypothetical protein
MSSPSVHRKSPLSQQSTDSSKKGKRSPKSPLENFEDTVVKRLEKAVTHVTSNLEAVSRQLKVANDSLVESISLNTAPEVPEFRNSQKKISDDRHSSPNNYELQYVERVDQIEEELRMRMNNIHFDSTGKFADNFFESTEVPNMEHKNNNIFDDRELFGSSRNGEEIERIDEYSDTSDIPMNILRLVEDSLKDKLRTAIRLKSAGLLL